MQGEAADTQTYPVHCAVVAKHVAAETAMVFPPEYAETTLATNATGVKMMRA